MPKLTKTQQQTADKIIKIGREMGKTDTQIKTALKIAYIESSLGENKGKNSTSSARGVYQYLDGTWKNHEGTRENDEDSIRAFYKDMQNFDDRYNQHQKERQDNPLDYAKRSQDAQIPADVSREEYIYTKHHDGPNAQGSSFKRDSNMEKGINIYNDRVNRDGGAAESAEDAMRNHKEEPIQHSPTTVPQASILDYFGKAAGQIGAAVSAVGHVAFDAAIGLGKETLNQTIRLALSQGAGGKGLVKQAARMSVGNMLAGMHAQVMEKIMRDPTIPVGIAGQLERPQASVEDVMNNPRNQGVFDQIADAVMRLLGRYPDLDPGAVLVDQGLKHIRQGDLKIPHGILLPDIFPMDRKTGVDGSDGQYVEVLGIKLPIRLPDVRVIDESGAVNGGHSPGMPSGMPELAAFRGGDGVVEVRAYGRGGTSVRSHTRSKPDGDVTNNLSYRKA